MGADDVDRGKTSDGNATVVTAGAEKGKKKTLEKKTNVALKKAISEEKDFVDDKELMAAIQFGVLKTADDVASTVGERNAIDLKFDEEVVSRVALVVWDAVIDNWVNDLGQFASHANRQTVNLEDVALMTRRNPALFKAACEMTNTKYNNIDDDVLTRNPSKGRKRKVDQTVVSPVQDVQDNSRSFSPLPIETPKSKYRKTEFLKTPEVEPMTSTPKVGALSMAKKNTRIFDKELTPIRPTDVDKTIVRKNLTRIEEEDSFERFFEDGKPTTSNSTMKKRNISSMIREAEEDPLPGEATHMEQMEKMRLEAMLPQDDFEYDSFDDDVIVDSVRVARKSTTPTKKVTFSGSTKNSQVDDKKQQRDFSKSPDLFADSKDSSGSTIGKKSDVSEVKKPFGFTNKVSDFNFDDDDSFDAGPSEPKKEERKREPSIVLSDDSFDEAPKNSIPSPAKGLTQKLKDSFDSTPKSSQKNKSAAKLSTPQTSQTQKSTTKNKWAKLTPKTPANDTQTEKSKKNKLSMDYDSFDEFDFGV